MRLSTNLALMSPQSREVAHDKMNYIVNNVEEHNMNQLNRAPMAIDDLLIQNRTKNDVSSITSKVRVKL